MRILTRTAGAIGLAMALGVFSRPVPFLAQLQAASSAGCEGGGFSIVLPDKTGIFGPTTTSVPASRLGVNTRFTVQGKYVEFTVVSDTFGIENYTFTGAPNALDIAGGVRTTVFARKTPEHRGLTLGSALSAQLSDTDIVISRTGTGLSMKIQAKDCANGGLFQMEPSRGDGTATRITHVLATAPNDNLDPVKDPMTVFYFDNPNFRARETDVVPYKDTTVTVTPRVNFANGFSPKFVGRDSPQVGNRVNDDNCANTIQRRPDLNPQTAVVKHCGGVSVWDVASGGRMGAVFGEDATEVAPPATNCTQNCQAQNRVRGRAVVLGFAFPVPDTSRLKPRFPPGFVP